jgi:hypothetical protein
MGAHQCSLYAVNLIKIEILLHLFISLPCSMSAKTKELIAKSYTKVVMGKFENKDGLPTL